MPKTTSRMADLPSLYSLVASVHHCTRLIAEYIIAWNSASCLMSPSQMVLAWHFQCIVTHACLTLSPSMTATVYADGVYYIPNFTYIYILKTTEHSRALPSITKFPNTPTWSSQSWHCCVTSEYQRCISHLLHPCTLLTPIHTSTAQGSSTTKLKQPNKPVYRALGNPTRGKVTSQKWLLRLT